MPRRTELRPPRHPMLALKRLRLARGLTLHDLARKLGVAVSTVFRWESGSRAMTVDLCERVAAVLGTRPAVIAGWEDSRCLQPIYKRPFTIETFCPAVAAGSHRS